MNKQIAAILRALKEDPEIKEKVKTVAEEGMGESDPMEMRKNAQKQPDGSYVIPADPDEASRDFAPTKTKKGVVPVREDSGEDDLIVEDDEDMMVEDDEDMEDPKLKKPSLFFKKTASQAKR